MAEVMHPKNENLYRLPWSKNDNPIGWEEITDICNIKCKGCYRLVMGEGHKPLEQIKEEILMLKKWRNCDNITLAGGEPTIYPKIIELVQFITDQKMKSVILTNGYALNDKLCKDLKKAGLTGFSFHLDSTQTRPEFNKEKIKSEADLNDLRLKLAKMVTKAGFYGHFGITVTSDSLHEIPMYIDWAIKNVKYINGMSLIIYRGIPLGKGIEYTVGGQKVDIKSEDLGYTVEGEETEKINVTSKDVYAVIKDHYPDYDACAYLGGTTNHTSFKWLLGNIILNRKGKTFGAVGKKTMEALQTVHHFFKGRYMIYSPKRIGRSMFLAALIDKKVRQALWKFTKYVLVNPFRFFYPINSMSIAIIQAPDILPSGTDMCDDCPDMCVFEGKLVYSCRLDEYRQFGDLVEPNFSSKEAKEDFLKKRKDLEILAN